MPRTRRARSSRPSRPLTRQHVDNAALRYLGRFANSAENLRRVLLRRLIRAGHRPDDPEYRIASRWIDETVARLCANSALDDGKYAEAQAISLSRRGVAVRNIAVRLAAKGIAAELIEAALARFQNQGGNADLKAAARFARRRRLGPCRAESERKATRQKDIAALARQGFSHDIARRIVDAADRDALDSIADECRTDEFSE